MSIRYLRDAVKSSASPARVVGHVGGVVAEGPGETADPGLAESRPREPLFHRGRNNAPFPDCGEVGIDCTNSQPAGFLGSGGRHIYAVTLVSELSLAHPRPWSGHRIKGGAGRSPGLRGEGQASRKQSCLLDLSQPRCQPPVFRGPHVGKGCGHVLAPERAKSPEMTRQLQACP